MNPESTLITFNHDLEKETFEMEDPLLIPGSDIVNIVQDIESENQEIMLSQTTKKLKTSHSNNIIEEHTVAKKTSLKIPMLFQGCKIEGNITINIQK